MYKKDEINLCPIAYFNVCRLPRSYVTLVISAHRIALSLLLSVRIDRFKEVDCCVVVRLVSAIEIVPECAVKWSRLTLTVRRKLTRGAVSRVVMSK